MTDLYQIIEELQNENVFNDIEQIKSETGYGSLLMVIKKGKIARTSKTIHKESEKKNQNG